MRDRITWELQIWGDWIARHSDYTGYSGNNTLTQLWSGGGGKPGHKILCLEMPKVVRQVHLRVVRLADKHRNMLALRYATPLKDSGQEWTVSEMANFFGITEQTFRKKVSRARKRYSEQLVRA